MNLNDITVLIPSIGRNTIKDSLDSIPIECKVHILLDTGSHKNRVDFTQFDNLIDRYSTIRSIEYNKINMGLPGPTKQELIKSAKTKYFIILDDDDYFHPMFLASCCNIISTTTEDIAWISTHWKETSKYNKYKNFIDKYDISADSSTFESKYWDWVDGKIDNQYTLSHIYPCTEVLVNTNLFHQFQSLNLPDESKFERGILDDAIPMLNFMINTFGLNHQGWGIFYHKTNDSVSRTVLDSFLETEVEDVIKIMTRLYLKTRNKVWLRAINNALRTCDYNFKFTKFIL